MATSNTLTLVRAIVSRALMRPRAAWLEEGESISIDPWEPMREDTADAVSIGIHFVPKPVDRYQHRFVERYNGWTVELTEVNPPRQHYGLYAEARIAGQGLIAAASRGDDVLVRLVMHAVDDAVENLRLMVFFADTDLSPFEGIPRPKLGDHDALEVYADQLLESGWVSTVKHDDREHAHALLLREAREIVKYLDRQARRSLARPG